MSTHTGRWQEQLLLTAFNLSAKKKNLIQLFAESGMAGMTIAGNVLGKMNGIPILNLMTAIACFDCCGPKKILIVAANIIDRANKMTGNWYKGEKSLKSRERKKEH